VQPSYSLCEQGCNRWLGHSCSLYTFTEGGEYVEEGKVKSVLKSRKLWYALGTAASAFAVAYWGTTNPEYVTITNKLIAVIGTIGGLLIGGHSITDAARQIGKKLLLSGDKS